MDIRYVGRAHSQVFTDEDFARHGINQEGFEVTQEEPVISVGKPAGEYLVANHPFEEVVREKPEAAPKASKRATKKG